MYNDLCQHSADLTPTCQTIVTGLPRKALLFLYQSTGPGLFTPIEGHGDVTLVICWHNA